MYSIVKVHIHTALQMVFFKRKAMIFFGRVPPSSPPPQVKKKFPHLHVQSDSVTFAYHGEFLFQVNVPNDASSLTLAAKRAHIFHLAAENIQASLGGMTKSQLLKHSYCDTFRVDKKSDNDVIQKVIVGRQLRLSTEGEILNLAQAFHGEGQASASLDSGEDISKKALTEVKAAFPRLKVAGKHIEASTCGFSRKFSLGSHGAFYMDVARRAHAYIAAADAKRQEMAKWKRPPSWIMDTGKETGTRTETFLCIYIHLCMCYVCTCVFAHALVLLFLHVCMVKDSKMAVPIEQERKKDRDRQRKKERTKERKKETTTATRDIFSLFHRQQAAARGCMCHTEALKSWKYGHFEGQAHEEVPWNDLRGRNSSQSKGPGSSKKGECHVTDNFWVYIYICICR